MIRREIHAQFIACNVSVTAADHAAVSTQSHELSGDGNAQVWIQQRLVDACLPPGLTSLCDLAELDHGSLSVLLYVFASEMHAEQLALRQSNT